MNKYDNINIKIYMGVNMQDKELVKCLIPHFEFFLCNYCYFRYNFMCFKGFSGQIKVLLW